MKQYLQLFTNPSFILFVVVALCILCYPKPRVEVLQTESPTNAHIVTKFKHGTIWEEWCVYTFPSGHTTQNYVGTIDVSDPNYQEVDRQLSAYCH